MNASAAPAFWPAIRVDEPVAAHWLAQAAIRLRREICWQRHEPAITMLGRAQAALDEVRFDTRRREFFQKDATAAYLSAKLAAAAPEIPAGVRRGTFSWLVRELGLGPADCFALALALLPVVDHSAEAVIASVLGDASRSAPTLMLIQKLWDEPLGALSLIDPGHPLFRHGVIAPVSATSVWEMQLVVPWPVVAPLLMLPDHAAKTGMLGARGVELNAETQFAAARFAGTPPDRLRVIPLSGSAGAPFAATASAIAEQLQKPARELTVRPARGQTLETWLSPWLTRAWLEGGVLFLGPDMLEPGVESIQLEVPATLIVATTERGLPRRFAGAEVTPAVLVPPSSFEERRTWWCRGLGIDASDAELQLAAAECARRFRFEHETIAKLSSELRGLGRRVSPEELVRACRRDVWLGELAQPLPPRFRLSEVVIPTKQQAQLSELIQAMRNLTRVHHEWGTARPWAEGGLTALFAGPPGTGKTMAAEAIAAELELPVYRIDLSQVVNKYIGETEKNLRRLFDAADTSDLVLFFDEADSLFGKRTEVRDAHDRYANLEVSYLLERMERFKGLAILATNRKNDIDAAFMRRLRFVVDFPLPGVSERERIWRGAIPEHTEADLDFSFLGRQFPLAGGHIRSIVFQACLQAAERDSERKLTMPHVVHAIAREYDKLDRATSLHLFGPWAGCIEGGLDA